MVVHPLRGNSQVAERRRLGLLHNCMQQHHAAIRSRAEEDPQLAAAWEAGSNFPKSCSERPAGWKSDRPAVLDKCYVPPNDAPVFKRQRSQKVSNRFIARRAAEEDRYKVLFSHLSVP
jgi:hypothetical protein